MLILEKETLDKVISISNEERSKKNFDLDCWGI